MSPMQLHNLLFLDPKQYESVPFSNLNNADLICQKIRTMRGPPCIFETPYSENTLLNGRQWALA